MTEKEMLQQEMAGREAAISDLGRQRDLFIKVQGLDSSVEKAKAQVVELNLLLKSSRDRLAQLQAKKNESLERSLGAIEKAITGFLPAGAAVIRLDPETGALFIGWTDPATKLRIAHKSLSGGEKVAFDFALAHALGASVIVGEFAEVDERRLPELLDKIRAGLRPNAQAVVLTCHPFVGKINEAWGVTAL